MIHRHYFLFATLLMFALVSCIEKTDNDMEMPVVTLNSPQACDTLYFGDPFLLSIDISDNKGLGNVSMDLHNNFGQHNHGAHESCVMDAPKTGVNPYYGNWIFSLPAQIKEHRLDTLILLEQFKDGNVHFDTGDYHFHIYVTDSEGYQVFTTLDVKVRYR